MGPSLRARRGDASTRRGLAALAALVFAGGSAGVGRLAADDVPWSLSTLLSRVPPLRNDASGRLPLVTWEAFRAGAGDESFRRHEPLPPEAYRELARRGLTQRLPLDEAYVSMAVAIQRAGARVAIVDAESGNGPAASVHDALHRLPPRRLPRFPCPLRLDGWRLRADRLRQVLGRFREAGVTVDAVWLDWEVEPFGGRDEWSEARDCRRCRDTLPAGALDDEAQYAAFIAAFRNDVLSAYVAAPVLEVYPKASVTNWNLVISTADRPTPSWIGDGPLPPSGLGLFTAANPVVYGDTMLHRHGWKAERGWPLDVAHMDRIYTRAMLGGISGHAANAARVAPLRRSVPWVARYCPDDPDPRIPVLSRERYREILRHVFLRGAESLQVFNALRPGRAALATEEVEDAVAVDDEMLAERRFLERGVPIGTSVPDVIDDGPLWSGLRLGDEALVRAVALGDVPVLASVPAFDGLPAATLEAPPSGATYWLRREGDKVTATRR